MSDAATESALSIEYIALDEVVQWPGNPKAHDIPALAESIRAQGFVGVITVDENTGRLVEGHGRLETLTAMRDAGQEPPARIEVDGMGRWLVPVLRGIRFNSEEDAAAYLVASNQLTVKGGWDEAALATMLRELEGSGRLSLTGFDPDDMEDLLSRLGEVPVLPEEETKAEFSETPEEAAARAAAIASGVPHKQVILLYELPEHESFLEAIKALKRSWKEDSTAAVVHRAVTEAGQGVSTGESPDVGTGANGNVGEGPREAQESGPPVDLPPSETDPEAWEEESLLVTQMEQGPPAEEEPPAEKPKVCLLTGGCVLPRDHEGPCSKVKP